MSAYYAMVLAIHIPLLCIAAWLLVGQIEKIGKENCNG